MSRQLVESIIDKDFVLAESHFNDRLSSIMEKKLYERKRQVAAQMDEMLGGMSRAAAEKKYSQRGQTPRRASDVYGDPRDIDLNTDATKGGSVKGNMLVRKLAAKAIKLGKKYGGSEFRKSYIKTKQQNVAADQKAQADDTSTKETDQTKKRKAAPETLKKTGPDKPGALGRNWNTLMGRKAGYVKPETPEDEKGGNVGKVVRAGAKAGVKVAKAALSIL